MWLLNAFTRKLEYFQGDDTPPYTILSHRWEIDEVTFDDVRQGRAHLKQGYRKVNFACEQAIRDRGPSLNHQNSDPKVYLWVDTCCIDKSNSAELSEAINSMYAWYRDASVCYAYLSDVSDKSVSQLRESTWFYRGWTLQELLAPRKLVFFNFWWDLLGLRYDLRSTVAQVTGIPVSAFEQLFQPANYTAAEKFSWAARRYTTRKEDIAYCLLGIFEVNIPLIYGEGERAFRRLQEVILQRTMDLTILAWSQYLWPEWPELKMHGLLARSPESFVYPNKWLRKFEYTGTELGEQNCEGALPGQVHSIDDNEVELTLCLVPFTQEIYLVPIAFIGDQLVGMALEKWLRPSKFKRICAGQSSLFGIPPGLVSLGRVRRVIVDNREVRVATERFLEEEEECGMIIEDIKVGQSNNPQAVRVFARSSRGAPVESLKLPKWTYGVAGFIQIAAPRKPVILLHLGFNFDFEPFCLATRIKEKLGHTCSLKDAKFSFSGLRMHGLTMTSDSDIMRLASTHTDNLRNCRLEEDGIELHRMSFGREQEIFKIGNTAIIRILRKIPHYSISIHMFPPSKVTHTELNLDKEDVVDNQIWYARQWSESVQLSRERVVIRLSY